ncbi:hypothetical protein [Comamonas testosteroni]|uniref:hypothetical protein n=1 Tax=Comamonas testosteroni TaxID=285 RepID=UPI0002FEA986|nr:hypothetical protein [Comamonas testosteroni]
MSNMNTAQPVNSVALTCDYLRAQPGPQGFSNFQFRNLAWLERVIGAKSAWDSWGVKTSVITVPTQAQEFQRSLGNDAIFSDYLEDAGQTWASLYAADELQVFPQTLDKLLEHDLVVGFELPPTLKRALHKAGKRYISFYIHPVRFLRDLCFFVTTNSDDIASLIEKNEIAREEIDYQARRFGALFSRLQLPALSLPENVPVLIGQTERDSVLIRGGKFTTWENHESNLAEILAPYPEVIFLEHPYRPNSSLTTEYFRSRHGKTVISLRGNSYGVIFSPIEPPLFLTLASSLGIEARYAGRKCIFLSTDPCEQFVLGGVDVPSTVMVSHAVLQDEFWRNIFSGQFQKKAEKISATASAFPLGDNFLRNSLESWAFRPLQSGAGLDPVLKKILPSAVATDERLTAISTALCAEAPGVEKQKPTHGKTQQAWGTVETLAKPFPRGVRSEVDFSLPSAAHYLVEGFHAPEGGGVWSNGKYAKLVLPIDLASATDAQVEISMVVKVFSGALTHAPVLQIMMDDREVGVVLFRKTAKNDQQIHFTGRVHNPTCQIEFRVSHTATPAMSSSTTDHRELGFSLCALSVGVSSVNGERQNDSDRGMTVKFWGVSTSESADEGGSSALEGRME